MAVRTNILLKLSNFADGLITGAKLFANTVSFSKIQQIGAYKTLANITSSTADLTEVNIGYIPNGAVTLSGNVTYAKADFAGKTHLLLSTNSITVRTLTISNIGFDAGDFICILIEQNSLGTVSIIIGSTATPRTITGNRGNIVQGIFDGTNWYIWSGGGVYNTANVAFNRMAFGLGSSAVNGNSTAVGYNSDASGSSNATAYGTSAVASGPSSCAFGALATATSEQTSAFGTNANATALESSTFGRSSVANASYAQNFGRTTNSNSFSWHNNFGAYSYARRYGAFRTKLDTNASSTDATNPSQNKEWATWNGTTANATITEIFLRGVSSNRCVLQAKNVLKFRGQATAFRSDYSGSAGWDITGLIKRDGSNVTTLIGVTATLTHSDGTGGTLVLTIDADDTNESLRVRVTGNASETWTWGVELELLDLRIA